MLAEKLRVQQEFRRGPAPQVHGIDFQCQPQLVGLRRRGQKPALCHALDRVQGQTAAGGQIGRAQAEGAAARREKGGERYVDTYVLI